jgi:hypothetical protein
VLLKTSPQTSPVFAGVLRNVPANVPFASVLVEANVPVTEKLAPATQALGGVAAPKACPETHVPNSAILTCANCTEKHSEARI